jgi:hypothetical protein
VSNTGLQQVFDRGFDRSESLREVIDTRALPAKWNAANRKKLSYRTMVSNTGGSTGGSTGHLRTNFAVPREGAP